MTWLLTYLGVGVAVATLAAIGGNNYSKQEWDSVAVPGLTGDQQRHLNFALDVVGWPFAIIYHLLR